MAITIKKEDRDAIRDQALKELKFARDYKQKKITNWHKNEDMYYARKIKTDEARTNVEIGKMQGFVHTVLSKIDNPLTFKFRKRKEADLKAVNRVNALREQDANDDDWDIKDIAQKKQVTMYGRAIFAYYASSEPEYKASLDPVDVYDFLVDPAAGGLDLEKGRYMGRYGIVLDREDIKERAKDGEFLKAEVKILLESDAVPNGMNQEDENKRNRQSYEGRMSNPEIQTSDKFRLWEWFTTYKGKRYYLLMSREAQTVIKIMPLEEMFKPSKKFPKGAWPFWTYAAYIDLTEFWTPSPCDYVREVFMAQSISINQMLDLAEQVIKPQKAIVASKIVNKAELKYKKDGVIHLKDTDDVNKAVTMLQVTPIDTPIRVYQTLDTIAQMESGVTAATRGVADEDKVAIYEGNQANTGDRFGLFNKSYAYGYKRFAYLWLEGVKTHLKKSVAIDMLGSDGIQVDEITRRDIKGFSEFVPMVQSSDAEVQSNAIETRNKINYLTGARTSPKFNQDKVEEKLGTLVGFNQDEIKEFLDVDNYANAELMSEAARDIELLLNRTMPKPNLGANLAYYEKVVNWYRDNSEYFFKGDKMDVELMKMFDTYIQQLDQIVTYNEYRKMNRQATEEMMNPPGGAAPTTLDVNVDNQASTKDGGMYQNPAQQAGQTLQTQ